jgi:hypothetical protein
VKVFRWLNEKITKKNFAFGHYNSPLNSASKFHLKNSSKRRVPVENRELLQIFSSIPY